LSIIGALERHDARDATPERRLGFIVEEVLDSSCNVFWHIWNTLTFKVARIGESHELTNIMRPHEPPEKRMSRAGVPYSTGDSVGKKNIFV
jgi:hypothetical protein